MPSAATDAVRRNLDLLFVAGIVGVLVAIFVPLPTVLVDGLLVINIAASVMVLLTSIYVREPLQFSVFPAVLLITTAFRLALNVATTRLVLSNAASEGTGAAGEVIETFANFVAGAQPFVGFIIFCILVIIQFVVITKGANRVAEVAARFTLDAMPGKQMAIDADLNAGLIKEADARRRRETISREADFYGAMDGATKFVRGDAIAGIIIILVNLIGGFVIGVFQHGMSFAAALDVYARLTVGDGLVTQVPALVVSIAAGLIVTRVTAVSNLGSDVLTQVFSIPRALYVAAAFVAGLTLVGFPWYAMLPVAAVLAFVAREIGAQRVEDADKAQREVKREAPKPEKVEGLLRVDAMELEVGYGLIRLADPAQGGDLVERVGLIRRQCAIDMGIVVPPIRIRDNMQLGAHEYAIRIRGTKIAGGSTFPDQYLAMTPPGGTPVKLEGTPTRDPAFNLPATWIGETQKPRAEAMGCTVVDATTVLATHLTEVVKLRAPELLTREETQHLVNHLKETHPGLVEEVVPAIVKTGELQKVLQGLLREGVSIRDLASIVETLGDTAPRTRDTEVLVEYCRHALARSITQSVLASDGRLHVVTVDPRLEDLLKGGTERSDLGSHLTLAPRTIARLVETLAKEIEKLVGRGHVPVVLCSPVVRLQVKRITEQIQPGIAVLSYNEVPKDLKVESHGLVAMEAA
ncbi:MAG: flagellar biosynthesis protein FlhA [Candidatus Brocadiae bacterium]|nr:flagellar biosynthesis protein FlhA [Candidatus Brocadiia bacterium]